MHIARAHLTIANNPPVATEEHQGLRDIAVADSARLGASPETVSAAPVVSPLREFAIARSGKIRWDRRPVISARSAAVDQAAAFEEQEHWDRRFSTLLHSRPGRHLDVGDKRPLVCAETARIAGSHSSSGVTAGAQAIREAAIAPFRCAVAVPDDGIRTTEAGCGKFRMPPGVAGVTIGIGNRSERTSHAPIG
jgi:hypothetical protein